MTGKRDPRFAEAMGRFAELFARAGESGLKEPTACSLATVDATGRPSSRIVLLKSFDDRGFVFFTNFNSRKGRELLADPRAALCFFWEPLYEQVRIEGQVRPVADQEADDYWVTRPRDSQLGAWASHQSEPLEDRATLEARFRELKARYGGQEVPRPAHWSGFRLAPDMIEFWRGIAYRLHERACYRRQNSGWTVTLLNP